jgi:glutamate dehydrogenase/leucine dehydrogenase
MAAPGGGADDAAERSGVVVPAERSGVVVLAERARRERQRRGVRAARVAAAGSGGVADAAPREGTDAGGPCCWAAVQEKVRRPVW